MISYRTPEERGFTIPELVIVLAVGFVLVGLGFSLLLFAFRSFTRWKERREVRSAVERVAESVAIDIARSLSLEEITDSSFVLSRPLGVRSSYIIQDDRVLRNGVALHGEDVKVSMVVKGSLDGEEGEGVYLLHLTGTGKSMAWTVEMKAMPASSGRATFKRRRAL